MPDPFSALTTMGITTVEELQALVSLFTHQQRNELPPVIYTKEPSAGPNTPHWLDGKLVDNEGKPVYNEENPMTIAANNLTRDFSQGIATGRRYAPSR